MTDDADKHEERLWAKIDVRGPQECWPWKASTTSKGCVRGTQLATETEERDDLANET